MEQNLLIILREGRRMAGNIFGYSIERGKTEGVRKDRVGLMTSCMNYQHGKWRG